jgi:iron-sulfur cluster repair protein YtfE (RIC family)
MITLGKKGTHSAATDRDIVDLLLDCHERIRSMTALARRLAEAEGLPEAEIVEAADRVRRYFGIALALHARDEDESLVPRLRGKDSQLDAALAEMSREHGEHDEPVARLLAACDVIAEEPGRLAEVAPALGTAARELERHFVVHLEREEKVIFPAIREHLPPTDLARMVEELRARRS